MIQIYCALNSFEFTPLIEQDTNTVSKSERHVKVTINVLTIDFSWPPKIYIFRSFLRLSKSLYIERVRKLYVSFKCSTRISVLR